MKRELLVELALALYSQSFLSFGKARELAEMPKYEFGLLVENGVFPGIMVLKSLRKI